MPRNAVGLNWRTACTTDKTELTIASGDITVTLLYHTVDTQSDDATDNLDGITPSVTSGSDADGYMLLIRPANDARTIVVRHNQNAAAAKNILLNGDVDITLDDEDDTLLLMYDISLDTNGAWIQVSQGPAPATHTKYTDAEAVLAVEAETTLEFDAATTISTAADDLTLAPAGISVITGDARISSQLAVGTTILTGVGLRQEDTIASASSATVVGTLASMTDNGSDGGSSKIRGMTTKAVSTRTGGAVSEMTGILVDTDSIGAVGETNHRGIFVTGRDLLASSMTNYSGIEINTPALLSATPTTSRQLWIKTVSKGTDTRGIDIEAIAGGTNRYGIKIADITAGTIARMIDASVFQIRGSGEYTDAANETPMFLNEGSTPTLRQVKWKAGDVLGSGDKVMVLV